MCAFVQPPKKIAQEWDMFSQFSEATETTEENSLKFAIAELSFSKQKPLFFPSFHKPLKKRREKEFHWSNPTQDKYCKIVWKYVTLVISSDKTQDIFMSQHDCLVDFCFTKPRPFISGGKDLYSNILSAPFSTPDFTKSAFSNDFLKNNSPCNCPLDKER